MGRLAGVSRLPLQNFVVECSIVTPEVWQLFFMGAYVTLLLVAPFHSLCEVERSELLLNCIKVRFSRDRRCIRKICIHCL